MKSLFNQSTLDQLVSAAVTKKYIYGSVFYVSNNKNSIDIVSASGNIEEDSQYYVASINKFFISALILRLVTNNKLDLYDKISKYLSQETMHGLHVYKGKDYSNDLTVLHLMSQTSGLPCYLIDKQANGNKTMNELEAGIDQSWPIDKVIRKVKKMKPHFPPGEKSRSKYIDTNHQILSLIIANITGDPINIALRNLFRELDLNNTYVCGEESIDKFVPIRYKSQILNVPLFLSSTHNDIISTTRDQMIFLKAFFNGYFFPKEKVKELERWNKIFFPFQYGIGIQKFHLPRILWPFQPVPDMIGHSGSTGSVAFYIPEMELYITGTVNQQARPNVAFQTMIHIVNMLRP